MDFTSVLPLWPAFARGTFVTVSLTISILLISTPAAVLVALARDSRKPYVSVPFLTLSWITRGIPPLLLLLIAYFVPAQFGIRLPAFVSALIAMSVYMAFYFGEVFRGGLASINRGQYEAGDALGLSRFHIFRRIVLPQLIKPVIPPYISHASTLLKNTALATAVGVREVTGIAKDLFAVTYRPFETLLVVAVIYGILSACLFLLQSWAERHGAREAIR